MRGIRWNRWRYSRNEYILSSGARISWCYTVRKFKLATGDAYEIEDIKQMLRTISSRFTQIWTSDMGVTRM